MRRTMSRPPRSARGLPRWAGPALAALLLALPPAAHAAKEHFVIAFQGDAATLDAQGRNETTTISIQMHMFEALIFRAIDGGLEPGLALSWKAASPTRWLIKLRKGVRFHDGAPFTAEVAKESLLRAQGKGFAKSQMKHFTKGIKEVRVVDEATLENGCMRFIPGSHKWGLIDHTPLPGQEHNLSPQHVDLSTEIAVPCKAGDVALFHTLVLHHSLPNRTDQWRRSFICHYIHPDAKAPSDPGRLPRIQVG